MTKPFSVFLPVVVFATGLIAAPLREADLGANTAWFLHLDLDAFRSSTAGQTIWAQFPEKAKPLARLQNDTGFDVRTHLAGITAYGPGQTGQGAIVVRHHFSNEKLVTWLAQKDFAILDSPGGIACHVVPTQRHNGIDKKLLIAFPRDGVVLLAADAQWIDTAAARLTASAPVASIPGLYRDLQVASPLVSAAANVAALNAGGIARHPWAKNTRLLAVTVGSRGDALTGEIRAELVNNDTAQKTGELVRTLSLAQAPRFPALDSVNATAINNFLHVTGTVPVEQLIAGITRRKADAANIPSAP